MGKLERCIRGYDGRTSSEHGSAQPIRQVRKGAREGSGWERG